MITYRDKTQLLLAMEDQWAGQAGAFFHLPYLRETMTPDQRVITGDSIGSPDRPIPGHFAETSALGEVEFFATAQHLALFLPMILHGTATGSDHPLSAETTGADGQILFQRDDQIKHKGEPVFINNGLGKALTGWHLNDGPQGEVEDNQHKAAIIGLPPQAKLLASARSVSRRYTEGETPSSCQIYKAYHDQKGFLKFDGVMAQRLTIDMQEGAYLTAAASMIGRGMSLLAASGQQAAALPTPHPIGAADGKHIFVLENRDDAGLKITPQNSIITGFRLVLERRGMAPQYGLGAAKPRAILPGQLAVYGAFEMLLSDHQLFAALTDQHHFLLSLALDDGHGGGIGFCVPQVMLTDVSVSGDSDSDPIRAQFQFDASVRAQHPLISAFTALSS